MKKFHIRTTDAGHRQATWLELFFDLAFVISIATLSHQLIEHPHLGIAFRFILFFIPVWWVWNQFTWYASHFDNDDLFFRILMLLGVGGTLLMSAGLHHTEDGSYKLFVVAYVFNHLLLAAAWMRAYRHIDQFRPYIRFKLIGIFLGISLWGLALAFSGPVFFGLCIGALILQLLMPVFAWKNVKDSISVHQPHISERHGLFTIIVLGESLVALSHALGHMGSWGVVAETVVLFLTAILFWWVYFDWRYERIKLESMAQAFGFNYGHFLIYVALGIVAAGIGVYPQGREFGMGLLLSGTSAFLISITLMDALAGRSKWYRLATLIPAPALLYVGVEPLIVLGVNAIALLICAAKGMKENG